MERDFYGNAKWWTVGRQQGLSAWIRDNWTWVSALVYVYTSGLGMVFSYFQFNAFGVEIFAFAEVGDFVMAVFRDLHLLFILVFTILAMVFTLGGMQSRRRLGLKTFLPVLYISLGIISYFWTLFWVDHDILKKRWISQSSLFHVFVKDSEKSGFEKRWMPQLALIGATSKYMFLYDTTKDKNAMLVMPIGDVIPLRGTEPPSIKEQKVSSDETIQQLPEQIAKLQQQLQEQISALAAQIAKPSPSPPVSPANWPSSRNCTFTRDLFLGVQGDDVRCLQRYLNTQTTSQRKETSYFDAWTKAAVTRWQRSSGGLRVDGYFGEQSRAKYHALVATTLTPAPAH